MGLEKRKEKKKEGGEERPSLVPVEIRFEIREGSELERMHPLRLSIGGGEGSAVKNDAWPRAGRTLGSRTKRERNREKLGGGTREQNKRAEKIRSIEAS